MQKVFRDPIYGDISLELPEDRVLLELIDTASFQRLRRINQLGVSYFAFHGAEHSRLTHSIGTLHLMTRALDHLINISHGKNRTALIRFRQAARIAALLHDIGHGPFSHNFEQIAPPKHRRPHEEWSADIVREAPDIVAVLRRHRVAPDTIAQIIQHTFTQCPAIQELLSGHLDVDRMDYLLRDSHATGVKYGIFDWERLLRSLTVQASRRGSSGGRRGGLHLAITHKGLHALEELILARYFMYDQVYLHRTVLAAEFLLKMIMKRAGIVYENSHDVRETESLKGAGIEPVMQLFSSRKLSLANYLALDDTALIAAIKVWSGSPDTILADLASRFLSRDILVSVASVPGSTKQILYKKACSIAAKRGFDSGFYVGMLDSSLAAYPLPHQDTARGRADLMVITPSGSQPVSSISSVINLFRGKTFAISRICMPRTVRDGM